LPELYPLNEPAQPLCPSVEFNYSPFYTNINAACYPYLSNSIPETSSYGYLINSTKDYAVVWNDSLTSTTASEDDFKGYITRKTDMSSTKSLYFSGLFYP
jgi:hypothetical protein